VYSVPVTINRKPLHAGNCETIFFNITTLDQNKNVHKIEVFVTTYSHDTANS